MTDEQRAKRIHHHMYETCEGIAEHAERIVRLEEENEKLRELVRDMWNDIPKSESCGWDMSTNTCTGSDECIGECSYWYRMRELGIEVDS